MHCGPVSRTPKYVKFPVLPVPPSERHFRPKSVRGPLLFAARLSSVILSNRSRVPTVAPVGEKQSFVDLLGKQSFSAMRVAPVPTIRRVRTCWVVRFILSPSPRFLFNGVETRKEVDGDKHFRAKTDKGANAPTR